MKLHELKATGAFTTSLRKMAANMSLGDVKTALRASDSKKFDKDIVKALSFASSFRRHNEKVTDKVMTCTLEIPNFGMVDVAFARKHEQVIITSLTKTVPAKAEE